MAKNPLFWLLLVVTLGVLYLVFSDMFWPKKVVLDHQSGEIGRFGLKKPTLLPETPDLPKTDMGAEEIANDLEE